MKGCKMNEIVREENAITVLIGKADYLQLLNKNILRSEVCFVSPW